MFLIHTLSHVCEMHEWPIFQYSGNKLLYTVMWVSYELSTHMCLYKQKVDAHVPQWQMVPPSKLSQT